MNCKTLTLCGAVLTLSTSVWADESDGALVEKVAVRNRLFAVDGHWEFGGNAGFTLLSRLTDHYNFNLSVAYNVADWLGFELRGGYAVSMLTPLARDIRSDFAVNSSISTASDMADLWQMTANAVFGARFQPIYGKINLVAELPIHFQFYVWAGAGFGLFKHDSLALCTAKSGSACNAYFTQMKAGPLVSVALGLRFFFAATQPVPGEKAGQHSVKFEVRDYSYLDSYYVGVVRADATATNPTAGGQLSSSAGVTNLVQFDLGYSYIF